MYSRFAAVECEHWWFQGRRHVVSTLLRAYLTDHPAEPGGFRVLDVGSGTGEMVDMLKELGHVTAVDSSAQAVEYCRRRHPVGVTVRHGLVPDALGASETFDLVTAFDVVEHIEDDVAALQAFRRALAVGGRMVLTVPAYPLLWSQHDVYAGHVRRYRRDRLRDAVQAAGGFLIDRISYFNSLLFLPALLVRLAARPKRQDSPPDERTDAHLDVPPGPLNRALLGVFSSEARLLQRVEPPFGVSMIALCRAV